jgi:leader peptidase (prepilin peptidase)/N-methyltransferase
MSSSLLVLEAYPYLFYGITLLFGLIVGSFLNVVVYRLPVMMEAGWQREAREILEMPAPEPSEAFNLIVPGSRCPTCNEAIRPWHNIPVLSFLILGGKCNKCKTGISARYPIVEALTGVVSVMVAAHFGLSLATLAALIFAWAVITLSLIDFDTRLLPDAITLPILWIGIMVNLADTIVPLEDAIIGAVAGYLSLWSVSFAFKVLIHKEGMGAGDFKMLAMLGAWLGWQALPAIVILSSFAGSIVGIALILRGGSRASKVPFGPFLGIAGMLQLLWGDAIIDTYLSILVY